MQLGTSLSTVSPPRLLRLDNTSDRSSSLPLNAWLATQTTQQFQPLQQQRQPSLGWTSSSFDTNHSLGMNTTAIVATNHPITDSVHLIAQPSSAPSLISPSTQLSATTAAQLIVPVSPSPTLASRQLIEAAQKQQQHQQQQHRIQEEQRQRMQQPQSSALFSSLEQDYISEFLNNVSADGDVSTVSAAPTATSTASNAQSHLSMTRPDQQVSHTNGLLNPSENAYPSPEPYKPNKLSLLQQQQQQQQQQHKAASQSSTPTASAPSGQSKKRARDTTNDTSSSAKRVSIQSTTDKAGTTNESSSDATDDSKKELLTEEQKRSNHIRSEQKRRDTIRQGFQDLTNCVPALNGVRVSKSVMLEEAVAWINSLETECRKLQNDINVMETQLAMRRELARREGPAP